MKDNTALIDGDSICYMCSKDTIEESIELTDKLLEHMFETTGSVNYVLFLSKSPYFRHDINPEYKGNRKSSPLLWLKTLRSYLIEKYQAISIPNIEADDAVAHFKTLLLNSTICAIDKDVLKQVEGKHYNYRTREWVETSKEDAHKWLYLQALMGDSGDNIKGVPGIGPAKAEKILEGCPPENYKYRVLKEYVNFYGDSIGIKKFYVNFYQVNLLKSDAEMEQFADLITIVPVHILNKEVDQW